MKLANYDGRAALVLDGSMADVHDASGGRFGPDPMSRLPGLAGLRRLRRRPQRRYGAAG